MHLRISMITSWAALAIGCAAKAPPRTAAVAAPSPPPSPCSRIPGALYCDDFEAGLNPLLRPRSSPEASIAVDATRAHGGKMSLHAKTGAVAYKDAGVTIEKPVFPTPNNSFFVRAFVYWAPPARNDNVYLFRVSGPLPGTTSAIYAKLGAVGDPYNKPEAPDFKHLVQLIYHSAIKSADHKPYQNHAAPEVPYDRWACWELEVDGVHNQWRVWVDGVEQLSRAWSGTDGTPWVVPATTSLTIGTNHPHDENPDGVEVWYDDLVVGTQRVGC